MSNDVRSVTCPLPARLALALAASLCLVATAGAQQRVSKPPVRTSAPQQTATTQADPDLLGPAQDVIAQPPKPQHDEDPGGPGQGRQNQQQGEPDPGAPPQTDEDPGGGGQGRQDPQQDEAVPLPDPPADEDPGGPGQGRQVLGLPGGQPDLALVNSFQLGNATIPWGTAATVAATDAAFIRRGRCGFRYKYVTRNQGAAGAAASNNRIHRDAPAGPVLASNARPALAPAADAVSDGHVLLAPGTWMLYVHADDPSAVAESDEKNNLRRVRVTVDGKCE